MLGLKARRAVAQRWVSARRAFGPNLTSTHRMIGYRWSNVGFFWSLAPQMMSNYRSFLDSV